ncbi:MAG: hypothetical protein ACLFPQ_06095 [Candidatus Woesearchaeota archaeon]
MSKKKTRKNEIFQKNLYSDSLFVVFIVVLLFGGLFIGTFVYDAYKNNPFLYEIDYSKSVSSGFSSSITGRALDPTDISGVERSFISSSILRNNLTNISLQVIVDPEFVHTYFALEETVPSEFDIVDQGLFDLQGNTLKFIVLDESEQAESINLSYIVNASGTPGNYNFSGEYWIEGMDAEADISGDDTLAIYIEGSCTENWDCDSWGDCVDGTQTRTCTDLNECGTTDERPNPFESRSCTVDDDDDDDEDDSGDSSSSSASNNRGGGGGGGGAPPSHSSCTEDWTCSLYGACKSDGTQTRTCTDNNKCGTTRNKPDVMRSCEYGGSCSDGIKNKDETGVDCGGSCPNECEVLSEFLPQVEISAESIEADILDTYVLNVSLKNTGVREASGLKLSARKWSTKKIDIAKIAAGGEVYRSLKLNLPANPDSDSVTIQLTYKDALVDEFIVPVVLNVPKYSVKIRYDEDEKKFYSIFIIDNRNKDSEKVSLEYTLGKDGETLFMDTPDVDLKKGEINTVIKDLPLSSLNEGDYEIQSAFYEDNEQVWTEKTYFSLDKNDTVFNAFYISVVFMVLMVGVSAYIFISTAVVGNKKR